MGEGMPGTYVIEFLSYVEELITKDMKTFFKFTILSTSLANNIKSFSIFLGNLIVIVVIFFFLN